MSDMKKQLFYFCLFFLSTLQPLSAYSQTLIMNEVSNGPSGNQEYVEFIVIDTIVAYNCNSLTPPCIDIRGWIFDDNSGYHGTGGIAAGAVRFSFNPLWACVPLGTIILIYNDADANPNIPANDISLSDGNCTIIAPISNINLFDKNLTTPGAVACSYPSTGWLPGGDWTTTLLANTGDCARIVNLAGCEVFSVCWATDNLNNIIYFNSGNSGTQNVWYFNNGNPEVQANWTEGLTTPGGGSQTPGLPNNPANAAYISQFNNSCSPITELSLNASATNAGCTCDGTATANASGSIPSYTYEWSNAGFVPIGQTTATATNLCAGTYNVIVTSNIGCADTATVTITSSSPITISVNNQTTCANSSTTLTASPSTAGGTYSWSPGGQTSQTISVNPAITTTYTVSYTLSGCTVTNTGVVTVNPLPIIAVPDQTVCAGNQITLSGNGASTYSWNNGVTNGVAFTPASSINYTVIGTAANGCTATDNVLVTVNPLPIIAVADQTVCAGNQITLSGNGASTYSWNNGVTNGVAFTPASSTNYTVIGTAANGCVATDVVSVTVNPSPIVDAGNIQTVCAGTQVTLSGNGASSYSWNNGVTNGVAFTPAASSNYTVIGTGTNGCTATDFVTVNVNPLPIVNAGMDQEFCNPSNTTLIATGAATYVWSNGITNSQVFPTGGIGQTFYSVVGTDLNGCVNSDTVSIIVNQIPTANVAADVTLGNPGLVVNFTNNSSVATSYNWEFGNGETTTVFNSGNEVITYSEPGIYTVILTAFNGVCNDMDTLQIIITPFSTPIIHVPNVFTPNNDGSNDEFFIETAFVSSIDLIILNRWGQVVFQTSELSSTWNGEINGKEATDGVYFYKYETVGINGDVLSGHGNLTLIR